MELKAVIAALALLAEPASVRVVTDSQYVAKGMTSWIHGWKRKGWRNSSGEPVKNRDLWEELERLARPHRVSWQWIRGHSGHPENERADALARKAIQELTI
jgi:ribonuclease HI